MTYNISTNTFDTRVKVPFVLSLYIQYSHVYLVLCQMNKHHLKYGYVCYPH